MLMKRAPVSSVLAAPATELFTQPARTHRHAHIRGGRQRLPQVHGVGHAARGRPSGGGGWWYSAPRPSSVPWSKRQAVTSLWRRCACRRRRRRWCWSGCRCCHWRADTPPDWPPTGLFVVGFDLPGAVASHAGAGFACSSGCPSSRPDWGVVAQHIHRAAAHQRGGAAFAVAGRGVVAAKGAKTTESTSRPGRR